MSTLTGQETRLAVLDLFSGIGGFSLGLERVGFETVAFCEIEPYCRAVLAEHWPNVPCYTDVRELTADRLGRDGIVANVLCGGFPCQDISLAGDGAGLDGSRSGLWNEYRRLIEEIRPAWAIVENVSALRSRGLEVVLRQLTAIGYDAEWHCIPACAVGAPHRRDRIWIVAYPARDVCSEQEACGTEWQRARQRGESVLVSHADLARFQQHAELNCNSIQTESRSSGDDTRRCSGAAGWLPEPDVGRVAHGVPSRVDRLRALGNAVVPQIPELIGRAIVRAAA